jgi:hypothetical protein
MLLRPWVPEIEPVLSFDCTARYTSRLRDEMPTAETMKSEPGIRTMEYTSVVRRDRETESSFRWEADLSRSFQANLRPALWSRLDRGRAYSVVLESSCSEGRADLVWASFGERDLNGFRPIAQLMQNSTCSRILALLKRDVVRTEDYLLPRIGVDVKTFRGSMQQMVKEGLATAAGDRRFMLGPEFRLPEVEICSFEFKLANWRRALYQATRYRSFSHRVYVVLPPKSVPNVTELDSFRRLKIGLMAHSTDGESRIVIPAPKAVPTARHRLIRAVGMLAIPDPDRSFRQKCPAHQSTA